MTQDQCGGANKWAIRTEPGRPDPSSPAVIEHAESIHFGLGGGEKRLAVAQRHRSGHYGQPQVEKICHRGDGSAHQHAGSTNVCG